MTIHVDIGEANIRFSEFVAAAGRGEHVVVSDAGAPQIGFVAIGDTEHTAAEERSLIAERGRAAIGMYAEAFKGHSVEIESTMTGEQVAVRCRRFDTHARVWMISGGTRLLLVVKDAISHPDNRIFVSVVSAFEFSDVERQGRLPATVRCKFGVPTIGGYDPRLPSDARRSVYTLPDIHCDPVDRMLIARTMHADRTRVTADAARRRYPVRTIW